MWFLGNFGHLVSSYFERLYQEQEMNITRIIGNFDPQIQNMLQDQIDDGNPLPFVSDFINIVPFIIKFIFFYNYNVEKFIKQEFPEVK